MPLQNRVTPFGDIVSHAARGSLMGNRGVLHDDARRLHPTRRWTTKTWIACLCAFRGRKRRLMTPGRYTELFFLDEATALAAGHRPCFECRSDDANRFRAAWAEGNGGSPPRASGMDEVLHAERLDGRRKRLHPVPCPPESLPDGAMVATGDDAFLVSGGRLRRWSFEGYAAPSAPTHGLRLLTPPSIVRTLAGGYVPTSHPSAFGN